MPAPVCKSSDFKLNSLGDVSANTIYLGDASSTNWVSQGTPVVYQNNSILLTMAPDTVGTMLSSTHYVWYGKISATLRSSAGAGVVTAFIMMSDVKDEIDFEFVGTDLQHVQSNFYWQGVTNYTNSANLSAASTDMETHTYTFDWKPDSLTWSVDNQPLRTLTRVSTYNATSKAYQYPQTPARIMLSLWPAGLSSNPAGTVAWSGGQISWNSPYMVKGYYYAQVLDVSVECYSPPANANATGTKSYVYNGYSGLGSTVAITNAGTVLSSFDATGENPAMSASAAASASGMAAPASASNIPGGIGGAGQRGGSDDGSGSSSGSDGSASSSSASSGSASTFIQGTTENSKGSSSTATTGRHEGARRGSVFAALVAFVALTMM